MAGMLEGVGDVGGVVFGGPGVVEVAGELVDAVLVQRQIREAADGNTTIEGDRSRACSRPVSARATGLSSRH